MARVTARGLMASAFWAALKLLAVLAMIATPLVGVWIASSLAALGRGPLWLALFAGLLLCPILPVVWEAWAAFRWHRAERKRTRILATGDRLILRTLALSGAFVILLLVTRPGVAFTALSARGDWMLDGRHDAGAELWRKRLFFAASKLEWLYVLVHDNPYRQYATFHRYDPPPQAEPQPTQPAIPPAPPPPQPEATQAPPPPTLPAQPAAIVWPFPEELDAIVREMPASAETSIDAVARYIRDRAPEPLRRLKALHDWVADRVSYDVPALLAHAIPPQDAPTVFRTRLSVCAGYSTLLEALGRSAGLEVVYVPGDARPKGAELSGEGHAWNAAKLDGQWYLIDATWDSGVRSGDHFERRYTTAYFLTPPRIFNIEHLPDEPKWQLLQKPLSRGEFLRQPSLSPEFFAAGLELVAPDRSQVDVQRELEVVLKNSRGMFLSAAFEQRGYVMSDQHCRVDQGPETHVRCRFPEPGRFGVTLFANTQEFGTYHYVGQLQANAQ